MNLSLSLCLADSLYLSLSHTHTNSLPPFFLSTLSYAPFAYIRVYKTSFFLLEVSQGVPKRICLKMCQFFLDFMLSVFDQSKRLCIMYGQGSSSSLCHVFE